jgi:hypothetical protein
VLAKLRTRLSYANVMATLAFFLALAGGSYAAVTLKRNAVKNRHIAKNAVTAPKVKNASLLAQDFAPGQLPKGEQGEPGRQGETGQPGSALGYAYVNADGTLDPNRSKNVRASRRHSTGIYCVDFPSFVPRNVVGNGVATVGGHVVLTYTDGSVLCTGASGNFNVIVHTRNPAGDAADSPFFIAVN